MSHYTATKGNLTKRGGVVRKSLLQHSSIGSCISMYGTIVTQYSVLVHAEINSYASVNLLIHASLMVVVLMTLYLTNGRPSWPSFASQIEV